MFTSPSGQDRKLLSLVDEMDRWILDVSHSGADWCSWVQLDA